MKNIKTLVSDIYSLLSEKGEGWFTHELSKALSEDITIRLRSSLGGERQKASLRLSQMGPRCPRALWYSIHTPEKAETLPPWTDVKFAFGHILEALAITLAKAAGHDVKGEQDEVVLDGVKGHRDCVIDGCVVDVKSASSPSFRKFKDGSLKDNDSFGYLDQLDGYVVASYGDPIVTVRDKGYLLAIDKQLGHMVLYEHDIREEHIKRRIKEYRRIVEQSSPPACTCEEVKHGSSGNLKLDTRASYSLYKHCCFPHLRTFLYADGPVHLSKVMRRPDVPEIDRFGNIVS